MAQKTITSHKTPSLMSTHSRQSVGLTYVYPVISRRAGGVSIGINLNTNNACNWQCVYCQVPGLTRGKPSPVDLGLLEKELREFLDDVLYGTFMQDCVPEEARRLCDIAFSGNGEPTSAPEFPEVVERLHQIKRDYPELSAIPVRVITNGSFMGKLSVQEAIASLSRLPGEVWFKVDAIDSEDQVRTNQVRQPVDSMLQRLSSCAALCPTWLQSCFFYFDGQAPTEKAINLYLNFCTAAQAAGVKGAHLYTLARTPMQPNGHQLSPLSAEEMNALGDRIRNLGWPVTVSL